MEIDEKEDFFEALTFELAGLILNRVPEDTGYVVLFFDEATSETLSFAVSNPEQVAPAFLRLMAVMPKPADDEEDHDSTH